MQCIFGYISGVNGMCSTLVLKYILVFAAVWAKFLLLVLLSHVGYCFLTFLYMLSPLVCTTAAHGYETTKAKEAK